MNNKPGTFKELGLYLDNFIIKVILNDHLFCLIHFRDKKLTILPVVKIYSEGILCE